MEPKQILIEAALKLGEDSGMIQFCDDPTPAQVRSHFMNLFFSAAYFLVPFVLG